MSQPLFTGFNHFCVVTGDLDRAVRSWADRLGIGPWSVFRFEPEVVEAEVDGRPAPLGIRAALAYLPDGSHIELIEPLGEDNLYAASLARHGGADHLHHVRFDAADPDEVLAHADDAGIGLHLRATFRSGPPEPGLLRTVYLDTQGELGTPIEFGPAPEGFVMPEPEYVYPAPNG